MDKYEYKIIVGNEYFNEKVWEKIDEKLEKLQEKSFFGSSERFVRICKFRRNITPVKLKLEITIPKWKLQNVEEIKDVDIQNNVKEQIKKQIR